MVSGSYLFSFPVYWPKWPFRLPTRLNFGILWYKRDEDPKPLLWKRNGRIYGGRAWFQGRIYFRFQDYGHFGCPLGPIWVFWDLNKIRTPNYLHGRAMPHLSLMGVQHVLRSYRIPFCFQDNGQKCYFGCPFGSMRAFWNLNEIRAHKCLLQIQIQVSEFKFDNLA